MSTVDTADRPGSGIVGASPDGPRALSDPDAQEAEPNVLILPPAVERELNETDASLGTLGRPLDRRNPFFVGFTGALGVGVAYLLFRGMSDVTSVLVIVGVALFTAIGLNPIIEFLVSKAIPRGRPSPS